MKPIVVIVGRPNVGKSTLFNRVTRSRDALVDDAPGVTRDRLYGDARWDDVAFTLVDTGGFAGTEDEFSEAIRSQVLQAIEEADAVIHMLDGRQGISPFDDDIVAVLRKMTKPVFFAVNKIDGAEKESGLYDFYTLGIETLYPISAEHRYGIGDLLSALVRALPRPEPPPPEDAIRVAVVGRPNVGKSSLINRLLGTERLLVSDVPGTTRDTVDIFCRLDGRAYRLIDTAGIRRKGRIRHKIEKFSIIKALRSLSRCDIAVVVIDATEGITEQDLSIAGYAHERGRACLLVLNKWDCIAGGRQALRAFEREVRQAFKFLAFAPVLSISAKTGLRVSRILPLVDELYKQYTTRVGTGRVNRILQEAVQHNEPPRFRGHGVKLYYASQVAVKPPTFICFANHPEGLHFSYRRYLVNRFRQGTGLDRAPLRLYFRRRERRKDPA